MGAEERKIRYANKQELKEKMDEINEMFSEKYEVVFELEEFMILKKKNSKESLLVNTLKKFSSKTKFDINDKNAIKSKGHSHSYVQELGKLKNIIYDVRGHYVPTGKSCRYIETLMRLTNDEKYFEELRELYFRKVEKSKQKYTNGK